MDTRTVRALGVLVALLVGVGTYTVLTPIPALAGGAGLLWGWLVLLANRRPELWYRRGGESEFDAPWSSAVVVVIFASLFGLFELPVSLAVGIAVEIVVVGAILASLHIGFELARNAPGAETVDPRTTSE